MREIKNCPFCGEKAYITNGVMGNITMFVCGNYRNCGATVSFDNPLANNKPEMATMFWNSRKGQNNDYSDKQKDIIISLPNFNKDIFKDITGITVEG